MSASWRCVKQAGGVLLRNHHAVQGTRSVAMGGVTGPRSIVQVVEGVRGICGGQCGGLQAGEKWRLARGQARSNTEYGVLVDTPAWSFADGTPAPPSKGMLRRAQKHEAIRERLERLSGEIDLIQSIDRTEVEAVDEELHRVDKEFVEAAVQAHKLQNRKNSYEKY
eukprot:Nk52_evm3s392 gene=Nk52_evmTU3s392